MADARFEDAAENPLHLRAESAEDFPVLSSLVQDAVLTIGDVSWLRKKRRVVVLINRFRWEDHANATKENRPFERVQSLLAVEGVLKFSASGIDPKEKDLVTALLAVTWHPDEDAAGRIEIPLAGDATLALEVEAADVTLKDVTRPYQAVSAALPDHKL